MGTPSEILDSLPPSDVAAERYVIGSTILMPSVLDDLHLAANDFYADANRRLWAALCSMRDRGEQIDLALLVDRLRRDGNLEVIGGAAYIGQVLSGIPHAAHAAHYAGIVARMAKLRAITHAAQELLKAAYEAGAEPEDVLAVAEVALSRIQTGQYQSEPVAMADAVNEAMDRIDEIMHRTRHAGVMVGLYSFDDQVGGVFPGELTILAARPGQGKSSLAMQFAYHAATNGKQVYFATLEMSRAELAIRNLCALSGVSNQRIRTGAIGQADVFDLARVAPDCAAANMHLHDWPAIRVYDIRRAVRKLKPDLVVVDYLQIVTPHDRRVPRHEQVGQIATALKSLAREQKVPVVALAQLNRQVEQSGKETTPKLSHLKEAGKIEEDADMVLLLHRPDGGIHGKGKYEGQTWDATLDVAKNRNGANPKLRLNWDGARTTFTDFATPINGDFADFQGDC